jgi:hypothetical protein
VNRIRSVAFILLLCCLAIVLPYIVARLTYDEVAAEMGEDGWLAFWRGFPFHFVLPFEYGDEFRVGSLAYFADCAFWLLLLMLLRRFVFRRRRSIPSSSLRGHTHVASSETGIAGP